MSKTSSKCEKCQNETVNGWVVVDLTEKEMKTPFGEFVFEKGKNDNSIPIEYCQKCGFTKNQVMTNTFYIFSFKHLKLKK